MSIIMVNMVIIIDIIGCLLPIAYCPLLDCLLPNAVWLLDPLFLAQALQCRSRLIEALLEQQLSLLHAVLATDL